MNKKANAAVTIVRNLLITILMFLCSAHSHAQDAPPTPKRYDSGWLTRDAHQAWFNQHNKPGYISVKVDGQSNGTQDLYRTIFTQSPPNVLKYMQKSGCNSEWFLKYQKENTDAGYKLAYKSQFVSATGKTLYCGIWILRKPEQ